MATLMVTETAELQRYEAVIRDGLATCFQVGDALAAIEEKKLYRDTHATFKAYCQETWQFSDRRARQLIDARELAVSGTENGQFVPLSDPKPPVNPISNEGQARALKKVPPKERPKVLAEASKNGKLTAAKITTAAKKVLPGKPPKNGAQKGDPRIWARWDDLFGKLTRLADEMGREFPHALNHREITKHLNQAHDLKEAWQRAKR